MLCCHLIPCCRDFSYSLWELLNILHAFSHCSRKVFCLHFKKKACSVYCMHEDKIWKIKQNSCVWHFYMISFILIYIYCSHIYTVKFKTLHKLWHTTGNRPTDSSLRSWGYESIEYVMSVPEQWKETKKFSQKCRKELEMLYLIWYLATFYENVLTGGGLYLWTSISRSFYLSWSVCTDGVVP